MHAKEFQNQSKFYLLGGGREGAVTAHTSIAFALLPAPELATALTERKMSRIST
jgi:hypothetical protein